MRTRPARASDLPVIENLLVSAELTTLGVADHRGDFVVAEDAGEIVGCAGLEPYGPAALLRSVTVRQDYRNHGIARRLVGQLLERARATGVREIYLLTTTAAGYFSHLGFVPIDREAIETNVQRSAEFSAECCNSAQAMKRVLEAGRAAI